MLARRRPRPLERTEWGVAAARGYFPAAGTTPASPCSTTSHILLVDDDVSATRIIARWLDRPYRTIATARDGEEALASVGAALPDLIVTDVKMPRLDGWGLVRRLRASRETAFIPLIFLSELDETPDRIRGFSLGADDYVPKPVDLDELSFRVSNVLDRARALRIDARESLQAALEGSLSQFGIATLVSTLELEHKSGELVVWRDGETVCLLVREGRVIRAWTRERPEISGAECVYELLRWRGGQFAFSEAAVDVPDEIGITTTGLLLEGARRMDEAP